VSLIKEVKDHRLKAFENGVIAGVGIGLVVLIIAFWIFREELTTFTSRVRPEGFYMMLPTIGILVVILLAVGIGKEAYSRAKIP